MRRNIVRYAVLAYVITLKHVSIRVKKRFPTLQHIVDAGEYFCIPNYTIAIFVLFNYYFFLYYKKIVYILFLNLIGLHPEFVRNYKINLFCKVLWLLVKPWAASREAVEVQTKDAISIFEITAYNITMRENE